MRFHYLGFVFFLFKTAFFARNLSFKIWHWSDGTSRICMHKFDVSIQTRNDMQRVFGNLYLQIRYACAISPVIFELFFHICSRKTRPKYEWTPKSPLILFRFCANAFKKKDFSPSNFRSKDRKETCFSHRRSHKWNVLIFIWPVKIKFDAQMEYLLLVVFEHVLSCLFYGYCFEQEHALAFNLINVFTFVVLLLLSTSFN